MNSISYSSPKTEIKLSNINGKGIFAKENIHKDEIVAIKGGCVINKQILEELKDIIRSSELQIDDNFYLAPMTEEDFQNSMIYINHSCEPNIGIDGQITFIALRDIHPGEELTMDYAMFRNDNWKMKCNCKHNNCRKAITGEDWKIKTLQNKYGSFFSSFLLKKINS